MRMSVENGIVAFIVLVLVVVLELVIEGLEDEDRFAEDEDDYDIAAFTNNNIFSASRTLNFSMFPRTQAHSQMEHPRQNVRAW